MPMRFDGKHIFVTGGARGIGRAIAGAFGRERGILSLADCHADNLDTAVRELRGAGVERFPFAACSGDYQNDRCADRNCQEPSVITR